MYDLVIRGATVIDGSGCAPYAADVAISGDRIAAVGHVADRGREEIHAQGLLVTPGFVDVHTHYDGQVTWEQTTAPSANHGVTTVVMGNCGVGFAPCRPGDRDALVHLMEGVEDIPEVVMAAGLPWTWETFPEYLGIVAARPRDIDTAALLPHSCLRVYVMGERAIDHQPATPADLERMTDIAREAITVGALGFGTSRTHFHRSSEGRIIPSKYVAEAELQAIARGMAQADGGIIQAVLEMQDADEFQSEITLLHRVAKASGRPVTYTMVQLLDGSDAWRRALKLTDRLNGKGPRMTAQVIGRPISLLFGLNNSTNPFSLHPTFRALAHLPLAEKVAALKRPEVRAAILSEEPVAEDGDQGLLFYIANFDFMFPLAERPNYEPDVDSSIGARARKTGVRPEELAYDALLEDDGEASLMLMFANYADGNLDAALEMMRDHNTVLGLGDGGAHYGMVCDAGYPTFMLAHWTRDRTAGERLPLPDVIRWLSHDPARMIGLADRGLVAPGYKADINIIDYDRIQAFAPRATFDLPGGGRRLSQRSTGYVATLVSGKIVYREGKATGELPGRLIRGAQHAPAAGAA